MTQKKEGGRGKEKVKSSNDAIDTWSEFVTSCQNNGKCCNNKFAHSFSGAICIICWQIKNNEVGRENKFYLGFVFLLNWHILFLWIVIVLNTTHTRRRLTNNVSNLEKKKNSDAFQNLHVRTILSNLLKFISFVVLFYFLCYLFYFTCANTHFSEDPSSVSKRGMYGQRKNKIK
jgi:hypothetical protein